MANAWKKMAADGACLTHGPVSEAKESTRLSWIKGYERPKEVWGRAWAAWCPRSLRGNGSPVSTALGSLDMGSCRGGGLGLGVVWGLSPSPSCAGESEQAPGLCC
jgi:hypothetical protein